MAHHLHKSKPAAEEESSKVKVAASKGKEEKHHSIMEAARPAWRRRSWSIRTGTHEKHKVKKDPRECLVKHRIKEEIAATVVVGSVGFAFHEHQ
ncbi:hypothetical protein ZWY2020_029506 [Hordeum vulgare]|nr:hypothetical protein ZWY2020_029506 [Hordeum vulgare]